jgi:hypothetical protein
MLVIGSHGAREVEWVNTWPEARERLGQLRAAGYRGIATDMGDRITIIIDGGKRGLPLSGIPPREERRTR